MTDIDDIDDIVVVIVGGNGGNVSVGLTCIDTFFLELVILFCIFNYCYRGSNRLISSAQNCDVWYFLLLFVEAANIALCF